MLRAGSILETVLYADDPAAAARFYEDALGLQPIDGDGELFRALRVGPGSVLLLFNPALSIAEDRSVPPHGAPGPGHLALTIDPGEYDAWLARLGELGIPVEMEHPWPDGHRSIYVRDPAGNSVELITGDIWP
ncbi:MAG TPA: glyoxalase/bleomycin resistance/extradiol dioxygenase family protein [Phycisphaerales bacterium]|nr:glyoxalase/bleomycin resistance/extradiol dioxygenase family protein [Phycisphaerales bacterium]